MSNPGNTEPQAFNPNGVVTNECKAWIRAADEGERNSAKIVTTLFTWLGPGVIPSRADGEGPLKCKLPLHNPGVHADLT